MANYGNATKNTREHILSLYGHISGVKKNLKHVHEDVEKLGGKIDKVYWVLLAAAGTAALFALGIIFKIMNLSRNFTLSELIKSIQLYVKVLIITLTQNK